VPAAVVSPTFVPDLVNATLDLLIDGERGIWHLANQGQTSWLDFVREGAALAGVDPSGVRETEAAARDYTALGSERGALLPPLHEGLERYVRDTAQPARARPTDCKAARPAAGA
jgi:dTDP-4-dehydrorhamnose reductase